MKEWKISLAAARVNAGMTQTEAAERLGVTATTVLNWEKGKTSPRIEQVNQMADLYKVPMHDLFFAKRY